MSQPTSQLVKVGFKTAQTLQQAKQALSAQGFSKIETSRIISPGQEVPTELKSKSGLLRAGLAGGIVGLMVSSFIIVIALNIPNLASIEQSPIPFVILVPLGGASLGTCAGILLTFLSGAEPNNPVPDNYQLVVETVSSEEAQIAAETLLNQGGYLL